MITEDDVMLSFLSSSFRADLTPGSLTNNLISPIHNEIGAFFQ